MDGWNLSSQEMELLKSLGEPVDSPGILFFGHFLGRTKEAKLERVKQTPIEIAQSYYKLRKYNNCETFREK